MTDLLAKPHKCDLCGSRKEQREFACLADEDSDHSICLDCTIFAEKLKSEIKVEAAKTKLSSDDLYSGVLSVRDKLTREICLLDFGFKYFPELVSLLTGGISLTELKLKTIKENSENAR